MERLYEDFQDWEIISERRVVNTSNVMFIIFLCYRHNSWAEMLAVFGNMHLIVGLLGLKRHNR